MFSINYFPSYAYIKEHIYQGNVGENPSLFFSVRNRMKGNNTCTFGIKKCLSLLCGVLLNYLERLDC